jgi:hypothetical protein
MYVGEVWLALAGFCGILSVQLQSPGASLSLNTPTIGVLLGSDGSGRMHALDSDSRPSMGSRVGRFAGDRANRAALTCAHAQTDSFPLPSLCLSTNEWFVCADSNLIDLCSVALSYFDKVGVTQAPIGG